MLDESAAFLLPVATHVVIASCKGAVAIAFVALCRKLFAARLSPQVRHGLWLVVLASLLLPAGFDLPIQLRTDPAPLQARLIEVEAPAVEVAPLASAALPLPEAPTLNALPRIHAANAPTSRISPQSWLVLLWAAGVVGLAAVLALNLYQYRRIAVRAISVSGPMQELLAQCCEQIGLRRAIRLCESPEIAAPAVFGWWSPTLLLPPGLQDRLDEAQLRHVFLHEIAHVRRHDMLVNWIATGAQILHWFNPAVWFALRVMRSDMEQACDARALGQLSPQEHADYGQTLIGVLDAFPGRAPARGLGVVESHAQLKQRIIMIAKFSSRRAGSPILAAILLLALGSMAATAPRVETKIAQSAVELVAQQVPHSEVPVLAAQAVQPAAATRPAPVAQPTAKLSTPVPVASAASAVIPFTVRLLPLDTTAMEASQQAIRDRRLPDGTLRDPPPPVGMDAAHKAFVERYFLALLAQLRTVPGLTLLTQESPGYAGDTANYEIKFGIAGWHSFGSRRDWDFGASVRTLPLQPAGTSRNFFSGGSGLMSVSIEDGEPGHNLDQRLSSEIEQLRLTMFPEDPSLLQEVQARLLDPRMEFSLRQNALEILLKASRTPFLRVPRPDVIRRGVEFAATLTDPRQRTAIWSRLEGEESPDLVAPLAQALGTEKDAEVLHYLVTTVTKEYTADAGIRAALESIARSDPRPLMRMSAQRVLTGDKTWNAASWNDYFIATLKNPELTDAQRLDPFEYKDVAGEFPPGGPPLDDESIRILGRLLTHTERYSFAALGAATTLGTATNTLAREVVLDILQPGEGRPQAIPELRHALLLAQIDRAGSDTEMRAVVEDIAAHESYVPMREMARAILDRPAK